MQKIVDHLNEFIRSEVRTSLLERDKSALWPEDLYQRIADIGLFKLGIPKVYGGYEANLGELAQVYFDLARLSLDLPFVSSLAAHGLIATDLIAKFGSYSQKQLLVEMAEGRQIAAICNSESGVGTNISQLSSRIEVESTGQTGFGKIKKSCATNAPIADLFLVSAHLIGASSKPHMDLLLFSKDEVETVDFAQNMSCFRTGSTGSVEISGKIDKLKDRCLGVSKTGFKVFRRCFNTERFFLSTMVAGLLAGLEEEAFDFLQKRKDSGRSLNDHQYVQQKMLVIFSSRAKIHALVKDIISDSSGLSRQSKQLGLAKWLSIRDGLEACLAYFELTGFSALMDDNIAQKTTRDVMALRYFGGTMELQKMTMFGELERDAEFRLNSLKKSA